MTLLAHITPPETILILTLLIALAVAIGYATFTGRD